MPLSESSFHKNNFIKTESEVCHFLLANLEQENKGYSSSMHVYHRLVLCRTFVRIFVPSVLTVLQFTDDENKARDNIGLQKFSSINPRSFLICQHASGKSALCSEDIALTIPVTSAS